MRPVHWDRKQVVDLDPAGPGHMASMRPVHWDRKQRPTSPESASPNGRSFNEAGPLGPETVRLRCGSRPGRLAASMRPVHWDRKQARSDTRFVTVDSGLQ